jgi:hypothetical protein
MLGSAGVSAQDARSAPAAETQRRPAASQRIAQPQPKQKVAKPYFIEFRARNAVSYGHTYAVHGRVGAKITAKDVVGLHPATNSPIPWMVGHLLMVPSETGASDGDVEDQYLLARYRVLLTHAEYQKLLVSIRKLQASSPVWHAVFYNCNRFVADIAQSMGLKTPSSTQLYPKDFISELGELNTGKNASGVAQTSY